MKNSKLIKKNVLAILNSFSHRETIISNIDYMFLGKGFGVLFDEEGRSYFLPGSAIGGGKADQESDPTFEKIQQYRITSFYEKNEEDFHKFMGCDFRVKTIELLNGTKPSKKDSEAIELQIKAIQKELVLKSQFVEEY